MPNHRIQLTTLRQCRGQEFNGPHDEYIGSQETLLNMGTRLVVPVANGCRRGSGPSVATMRSAGLGLRRLWRATRRTRPGLKLRRQSLTHMLRRKENIYCRKMEGRGDPEIGKSQNTSAQAPEREIRPGQAGSSSDIPMDKVDEDAGGTILSDAPIPGIDIRLPSPARKKATKR